jgi:hypothetical protein
LRRLRGWRDGVRRGGWIFADGGESFPHLRLIESSVAECALEGPFELITCVHGLHYLGDKLGILAQYAALLSETEPAAAT